MPVHHGLISLKWKPLPLKQPHLDHLWTKIKMSPTCLSSSSYIYFFLTPLKLSISRSKFRTSHRSRNDKETTFDFYSSSINISTQEPINGLLLYFGTTFGLFVNLYINIYIFSLNSTPFHFIRSTAFPNTSAVDLAWTTGVKLGPSLQFLAQRAKTREGRKK